MCDSPRIIYIEVSNDPAADWVTRLTLAGITCGPTAGPNSPTAKGWFQFWIKDSGEGLDYQVAQAIGALGLPTGTEIVWSDPVVPGPIIRPGVSA